MSSQIEFYHVDAFEAPNYEPIWRALLNAGVDARLVAVPGRGNTASQDWFDYERLESYYTSRKVSFHQSPDLRAAAVTTQNEDIIHRYAGPKFRLMYGPPLFPDAWGFAEHAARPFDYILVHGEGYRQALSKWKSRDRLLVIGYPRYDDYFSGKVDVQRFRREWGINPARKTLIYTPTWGENASWEKFFNQVVELSDTFNVLIKPHHCTLRMEPARMRQLSASGLRVIDNAYDLSAVMAVADLILCDSRSSILGETLVVDRPSLALLTHEKDIAEWIEPAGLPNLTQICGSAEALRRNVERALTHDDFVSHRAAWAEQHVAFRDGSASRHAAEAIIQAISHAPVQVPVAKPARVGPRVSVILPTYNHLKYLPVAIRSITEQTYQDFELIIINDGSTDGTAEYLNGLRDPRIRVVHQQNQRLPKALNAGFGQARGELLTWTSADNYCAPFFLEALVGALDRHPDAGLAIGGFAYTDSEGRIESVTSGQDLSLPSLLKANPGVAAFLYRKSAQDEVGLYNAELEGAEDWDMWLRLAEKYPTVLVPEILYYYRQHTASMTIQIPDKIRRASTRVIADAFARRNNKMSLDELYPAINECSNQAEAETHAFFDFGTRMLTSPFAAPGIAANYLNQSFDRQPTVPTLVNLACAVARAGRWDQLGLCLKHLQGNAFPGSNAIVQNLTKVLQSKRPELVELSKVFVFTPKVSELLARTAAKQRVYSMTIEGGTLPVVANAPQSPPQAPVVPVKAPLAPAVAENLEELVGRIDKYIADGNYAEAIADLDKALLLKPDQEDLMLAFGFVLFRMQEFENAEIVFRRLISQHPKFAPVYLNLAAMLQHTGKLDLAEAVLRAGIEALPENVELIRALLPLFTAAGKHPEALELCKEILAGYPQDVETLLFMAKSQTDSGALAGAIYSLIDALRSLSADLSEIKKSI